MCGLRILSIFSTSRSEKAMSGTQSDRWWRLYFVRLKRTERGFLR